MSQAKDQDQSMEEILQSIKRIIAEEGTPAAGGSDVLELTDMLGDEPAAASAPAAADPLAEFAGFSIDDIMAAPVSSGVGPATPPPAPAPEPKPEPKPEPVFEPAFVAAPVAPAVEVAPEPAMPATPAPEPEPTMPEPVAPVMADTDSLISDTTREAAAAALGALQHVPETVAPVIAASMGFRAGHTVEDLVVEALKPMLRDWLDSNLTAIVERLVEKEVRRLSGR